MCFVLNEFIFFLQKETRNSKHVVLEISQLDHGSIRTCLMLLIIGPFLKVFYSGIGHFSQKFTS